MSLNDIWNNYIDSLDRQRSGVIDAYVGNQPNPVYEEMQYFDDLGWNGSDFGSSDSTVASRYGDAFDGVTYIPNANSGASVNAGTFVAPSSESDVERYMQMIKEISDANTARSVEMAREQNDWQSKQNKIAMDFNAAEALKQRNWLEYMSSSAHQREVSDLIAAGLNPVLSANNGASTGAGAAAQGVTSSGARGTVDTSYSAAALNVLNNVMQAASRVAAASARGSYDQQAALDALMQRTVYAQNQANYRAELQALTSANNVMNNNNSIGNVVARAVNGFAKGFGYDNWSDALSGITKVMLYGKNARYH